MNAGYQYFQDVDETDQSISGKPKPDAAFVANQLIVRAAAKFNAEDEFGDRHRCQGRSKPSRSITAK